MDAATEISASLLSELTNIYYASLTELINTQHTLISRLEKADAQCSAVLVEKINHTMNKIDEYIRRVQLLNRTLLELTKRVRSAMLRTRELAAKIQEEQ